MNPLQETVLTLMQMVQFDFFFFSRAKRTSCFLRNGVFSRRLNFNTRSVMITISDPVCMNFHRGLGKAVFGFFS